MERGGATPTTCADDCQQQQGSQRAASPTPRLSARASAGRSRGPHVAPPSASQARGGGAGLTVQQQQQCAPATPPTVSLQARHAFSLYSECVAAGQWARVTFEHRPEGEFISLSCRPSAAATTAARAQGRKPRRRRRPNKKRLEKRQLWQQSRGSRTSAAAASPRQQQQLYSTVAATSAKGFPAQGSTVAASPWWRAAAAAPTAAGAPLAAATAAVGPAAIAQAHLASSRLATSPRVTRSTKRKKAMLTTSPEAADPAFEPITQLDGAGASPPASPEAAIIAGAASSSPPDASSPPDNSGIPQLDGADDGQSGHSGIPPPPPWSPYFSSNRNFVICKFCLVKNYFFSKYSDRCIWCLMKTMKPPEDEV